MEHKFPVRLPIVTLGKIDYYRDDRLREYRQVTNPHNAIRFDDWPTAALSITLLSIRAQLNAIQATDVTTRMIQHFKDIESLARQTRKELEEISGERPQFTKRR